MINSKTQLNVVMGYPLEHSQSPLLHNTLYELLQCNAVMMAHASQDLATSLQALKVLGVSLMAVTMPFKQAILPYLDWQSAEVVALKAANTVLCRDGKLMGYNTDVDGIAYALRHVALAHKNVLILGAGGAARALAYYLMQQQAQLWWLNRTPQHVEPLIELFGGRMTEISQLKNLSIDIIINTTPVGMFPHQLHSPLPPDMFKPNQVVFDMVYNPQETTLLKNAKTGNAICIPGIEMFIGQGLRQVELWLDRVVATPDVMAKLRGQYELHNY